MSLDVNNFKIVMCEALTFQGSNLSIKEYSVGSSQTIMISHMISLSVDDEQCY